MADILSEAVSAFETDDEFGPLEDQFNTRYYSVAGDDAIFKGFEATLLLKPSKFGPV